MRGDVFWTDHRRLRADAFAAALAVAAGCAPLAGIEEKPCVPGCADDATALRCDPDGTPRAVSCPKSGDACARPLCRSGTCQFEPDIGRPCGLESKGRCNEGYACLGPKLELTAILRHTCALVQDGSVWCWGDNTFGQHGDGTEEARGSPVRVHDLPGPAQIVVVGYGHTCAIVEGIPYCWGNNEGGQCGTGASSPPLHLPERVRFTEADSALRFVALAAGRAHSCAISDGRNVYCWGLTVDGQCGVDGSAAHRLIVEPTRIDDAEGRPLDAVTSIVSVKDHTCALRDEAPSLVCWGSNWHPENSDVANGVLVRSYKLGPAANSGPYGEALLYSAVPLPVELGAPVRRVGMGYESTFAVTLDGKVYGWGYNLNALLGTRESSLYVATPSLVHFDAARGPEPLIGAIDVFRADGSYQCAEVETPSAYRVRFLCWGGNDFGELGIGDPAVVNQVLPYAVPARGIPSKATALALAEDHACVAVHDGETHDIWCYGAGSVVGNGSVAHDGKELSPQVEAAPVVWDPALYQP